MMKLNALQPPRIDTVKPAPERPEANPAAEASSFGNLLQSTFDQVNELQLKGDEAVRQMVSGENTDIHNTMITLQKAEVSFELMVQVRNKIVAAYDQIKNMQM
ncbi:MAG: flagellar hook-basal body complex protein FliE [Desulfosarcinaceae bacterium]|nr:flagellar hook-basal body complex protein FliE [Desulfosarcinaceae bacterium]